MRGPKYPIKLAEEERDVTPLVTVHALSLRRKMDSRLGKGAQRHAQQKGQNS